VQQVPTDKINIANLLLSRRKYLRVTYHPLDEFDDARSHKLWPWLQWCLPKLEQWHSSCCTRIKNFIRYADSQVPSFDSRLGGCSLGLMSMHEILWETLGEYRRKEAKTTGRSKTGSRSERTGLTTARSSSWTRTFEQRLKQPDPYACGKQGAFAKVKFKQVGSRKRRGYCQKFHRRSSWHWAS